VAEVERKLVEAQEAQKERFVLQFRVKQVEQVQRAQVAELNRDEPYLPILLLQSAQVAEPNRDAES